MKTIAELGLNAQPKTKTVACPAHGEFQSRWYFGTIWSKCPACSAEAAASERAAAEARQRAERLAAWQRKIGDAGIPERFRDRRLQTFMASTDAQRRALDFAQGYARDFDAALRTGRCALFIGKPGTGKTHLAVGIGMHVMKHGSHSVLFTTVMRAVRRVKDTWARGSAESESDAVAALVFPDLLILDEVGVQFGSDTERLILFDVLNERYERRRPTLLLSNLAVDEVKTYLGERIFDRLREDGGEAVVFDWDSHRKTAAVQEATQ